MRQRCNDSNAPQFKDYGGRGIKICKRWDKFENFLSDMGEKPREMSLDRKNNEKGYSKSNCRWATRAEQNRNKRNIQKVIFRGKEFYLLDLCEKYKMNVRTIRARMTRDGLDVETALSMNLRKSRHSERTVREL